jgi:hypothetical protein
MGTVDVTDDSIRRFVVRHYRYDPERRERRHVFVAAFDTEAEFEALIEAITADINHRSSRGEWVHRTEHASGVVYEPGDCERAAAGHRLRRMMEHGVSPAHEYDRSTLPRSMAPLQVDESLQPPHPG